MANDPGPSDWNNPARRYKWFRPRQAARGGIAYNAGAASKFTTGALFNSSTGRALLVVRNWHVYQSGVNGSHFGYYNGRLTGTNYPAQSFFPGDSAPAGLVDGSQQAAALALTEYQIGGNDVTNSWPSTLPFAVLAPGWSLVCQAVNSNSAMLVSFLWEEVAIDELDYFY